MSNFTVGMKVYFGRNKGEKTLGEVVKVNAKSLKVKQLEGRGTIKSHPQGTVWTVPHTCCTPANGSTTVATPTTPTRKVAKPSLAGNSVATEIGLPRCMVGETFTVNGTIFTVTGYKPRRPKYPICGTGPQGGKYKFTVAMVLSGMKAKTAAPRTEAEIMRDILTVYCGLSPENLHCDGEISVSQARVKERQLRGRLRTLETELGRHVDEGDAYRYAR